jgi:hypothetical protein
MRKRGLAPMLGIAGLLGALASPAHAVLPAVKVADCRTGKAPEQRLATFEGRMHGGKNVARMAMHFQLMQHTSGAQDAQPVASPDLAPWRRSRAGVSDFTYAQTIKGLSQGVTYSAVVQFRFFDAKGKIVRREERESGTCVQDGALPNLVVQSVRFAPGSTEKTALYTVTVANTGQGDAKSLAVTLIADGAHIDTRTVDSLKAGEFTQVKFTGPHCQRLRAIVDRAMVVPETVEEDNELRARC